MRYIPATANDVAVMLQAIGVETVADLFHSIPDDLKVQGLLDIPKALSEMSLMTVAEGLAGENQGAGMTSFLGGGAYDHFIPSVVDAVISRSEFATAYTPYQAEVAQGTLQAVFQMQTFVCELFGMEVANASNYEGASSLAEAALMSKRMRGRRYKGPNTVVVSKGVHPQYRQVLQTYLKNSDLEVIEVPWDAKTGLTDWAAIDVASARGAVSIIVQSPNHFGLIEDLATLRTTCDRVDAMMIVNVVEPLSLGLLKPPGAYGADIVTGEGQSLGIPLSFGGPYLGLFASKKAHVRAMPGRLVGETTDLNGDRGYVLTLSTREQHIRREKATSNICTNAGLMALAFTVFTALMGKVGFKELATLNHKKAAYVKGEIAKLDGYSLPFSGPTFNEFVVETKGQSAAQLLARLEDRGILGGIDLAPLGASEEVDGLQGRFLLAVTETLSRAQLDNLVHALKEEAQ